MSFMMYVELKLISDGDITILRSESPKNEQPRRKQRGIKRKILNAPRGGELNPRPPQAD